MHAYRKITSSSASQIRIQNMQSFLTASKPKNEQREDQASEIGASRPPTGASRSPNHVFVARQTTLKRTQNWWDSGKGKAKRAAEMQRPKSGQVASLGLCNREQMPAGGGRGSAPQKSYLFTVFPILVKQKALWNQERECPLQPSLQPR